MLNTITVYAVLTELPAVFLLYDSPFWSAAFILGIFAVSVWNGGGFYIEVFGRKCVVTHHSLVLPPILIITYAGLNESLKP